MAAGYSDRTVTRNGSGVSWSFTATAVTSAYQFCKVECEDFSGISEEMNVPAAVAVTGSADYGSADYLAGSRMYTIKQYVRRSDADEWEENGAAATCTVTWDTAALRIVQNGSVTVCSNIKAVSNGAVKTVTAVYSVQNGEVKPGT